MPFDLSSAIAVREREDGLLEKDVFDLSTAKPVEEIRAAMPGEIPYSPAAIKARANVELMFKERGEKTPSGLKFDWALTSPQAMAATEAGGITALTGGMYPIVQGVRGAADTKGTGNIMDRVFKAIVYPETTPFLYKKLPGTEDLPRWAEITASIAENIIAYGAVSIIKSEAKQLLLAKDITRKLDVAATAFAKEQTKTKLPAGPVAEEEFFNNLKQQYKSEALKRLTAIEGELLTSETAIGQGQSAGPSQLQAYANKRSLLGLIIEDLKHMDKTGTLRIPKIGQTIGFKNPAGEITPGIIKEIVGKRVGIELLTEPGKIIVATLSQLSLPEPPTTGEGKIVIDKTQFEEGHYIPKVEEVEKMVSESFKDIKPAKDAEFLIGPTASGKTSIAVNLADEIAIPIIDPDRYKAKYKGYTQEKAPLYHEASSVANRAAINKAIGEELPFLNVITGRNTEKFNKLVDKLKESGRPVKAHYIYVNLTESLRRNELRRATKKGMVIPNNAVEANHEGGIKTIFEVFVPKADEFTIYENPYSPEGKAQALPVAEFINGKLTKLENKDTLTSMLREWYTLNGRRMTDGQIAETINALGQNEGNDPETTSKILNRITPQEKLPKGITPQKPPVEPPTGEGAKPPIEPPKTAVGVPEEPKPLTEGEVLAEITKALKDAKPMRAEQEALAKEERGRRIAKAKAMGQKIGGEAGFYAQLGSLKGEMPKVQFESLRAVITQDKIDYLFNKIRTSDMNEWDKIAAQTGLGKLFGEFGGQVPTPGELQLLNDAFGKDFIESILTNRTFLQKFMYASGELLNIPRSVMASFDLSAPFRQGAFLIGKPKQFIPAFGEMFKFFGSEKALTASTNQISLSPNYNLMKEYGLSLMNLGSSLSGREELFMSQWAEKIPIAGIAIRASSRAYTGFLNKLRADVFDDLLKKARTLGIEETDKFLNDLVEFINAATGRGKLPGKLDKAAVALNSIFFSPRLMASRISLLNPTFYTSKEPFVRKEALKAALSFYSVWATLLGLLGLAGWKIGTDWRSSDFAKARKGKVRIDFGAGFQQYFRMIGQLVTGEYVSSVTGKIITLGEGYKPLTRYDILLRQLENKEAPVASFITTLLRQQTFMGEKVSVTREIAQRFTPMVLGDLIDLAKIHPALLPLGILGLFGVGLQVYGERKKSTKSRKKSKFSY